MLHLISIMISCLFRSFRSQAAVQAQIIALRHQLVVLQRTQMTKRLILRRADRSLWVWLSQLWSGWRSALLIVKPETVIAWHRQGFRRYWTWKIRHGRTGRPIFISQHCWLNTAEYSTSMCHGDIYISVQRESTRRFIIYELDGAAFTQSNAAAVVSLLSRYR